MSGFNASGAAGLTGPAGTNAPSYVVDAFAAGTAYVLTATPAAIVFGTTSPVIVIAQAGTYRLRARCLLQFNGATFAASRTVSLKLRRTNNTAGDVANSPCTVITGIITTITANLSSIAFPEVSYVTLNTDDSLTIFGSISVLPSVGSVDVVEASLTAQRIA